MNWGKLGKVELLFKLNVRGKRKLDSFNPQEGGGECSCSFTLNTNPVTKDMPCVGIAEIPSVSIAQARSKDTTLLGRDSSSPDAQTHRARGPMEVDTKVEEAVIPSSRVVSDGVSNSSFLILILRSQCIVLPIDRATVPFSKSPNRRTKLCYMGKFSLILVIPIFRALVFE